MNSEARRGTAAGLFAYLLWGLFPLYFHLLDRVTPMEILGQRIVWSVLVCLAAVALTRSWTALFAVLRQPRLLGRLTLAAVLLSVNWGVYVYAVSTGQVIEASLGYFINPLITILLGVVVLHERLRVVQWAAVAFAGVAVTVLTIDYGRVPFIALTLALSFGTYGLIKKHVGPDVDALTGMTTETLAVALPAAAYMFWLAQSPAGLVALRVPSLGILLSLAGFITVGPLLLFASAARRIPLSTMGLIQYVTPVMQFLLGVTVFHEALPAARFAGFLLVWVALVVLTLDSLRTRTMSLRAAVAEG